MALGKDHHDSDAAASIVCRLYHRGPAVTQRTDGAPWPEERPPQPSQRDAAPLGCRLAKSAGLTGTFGSEYAPISRDATGEPLGRRCQI
jgi:hypothetical protein